MKPLPLLMIVIVPQLMLCVYSDVRGSVLASMNHGSSLFYFFLPQ